MNERSEKIRPSSIRYRLLFLLLSISLLISLIITLIAVESTRQQGRQASQISAEALQTQAETYLQQITARNANENDLTLELLRKGAIQLANTVAEVYDHPEAYSAEYWQFGQHMFLGADGQYLNGEEDLTSVFIPHYQEVSSDVMRDVELGGYLEFQMKSFYEGDQNITAIYYASKHEVTRYYPNIRLGLLVPNDFTVTQRVWYTTVAPEQNPSRKALWSPVYVDATGQGLVTTASAPVYTGSGEFIGVVGLDVTLVDMTANIEATRFLGSGYTFLIDQSGQSVALPEQGFLDILGRPSEPDEASAILSEPVSSFAPVIADMLRGRSGFRRINVDDETLYVAYAPLVNTGWSMGTVARENEILAAVSTLQSELDRASRELVTNRILPASVALFLAVAGLGWVLTSRLVNPIQKLVNAAQQVAGGQWEVEIPQTGGDEIGSLGRAFASMTQQLKSQFMDLEKRVETRTKDLSRKTAQLEAASQVAREAAAIRDLDQLLDQVTRLISEKFGFYHSGIFLLDAAKEYAVLRAANSEGGQRMIARGHRLKVGEEGIVGFVAAKARPRIAFDVGSDAVFFKNPDLPYTRSEMAIPLKSKDSVIGVLDVQSIEPSAFSEEDVKILQVLADQVGLAVENARLIAETRQAIAELNRTYSRQMVEAWNQRLRNQPTGFIYTPLGISPIELSKVDADQIPVNSQLQSDMDGHHLTVPIQLRGQILGAITLRRDAGAPVWTEEELRVVEQAISQIGPAMENARLLEEAQERASREQAVNIITTRVRSSASMESILQNTVRELGKALGVGRTFIQLEIGQSEGELVEKA
jgi:GAF domain-containing protein/HAMP domain-containing protein